MGFGVTYSHSCSDLLQNYFRHYRIITPLLLSKLYNMKTLLTYIVNLIVKLWKAIDTLIQNNVLLHFVESITTERCLRYTGLDSDVSGLTAKSPYELIGSRIYDKFKSRLYKV